MKPDPEEIVCDLSMRFSKRIFMHVITRIMKT